MGFETAVINHIEDVVPDAKAYFAHGTLFVGDVDMEEARTISGIILKNFGNVIVNKVGDEFAYDFVH